jgi:lipoate-protein ligase A
MIANSIYVLDSNDPYLNLEIENYLLRNSDPESFILILWINRPCIVLGKFQNPWNEIKLEKAKRNNIDIVRRQSGGGCVYHDLGNLNFTIISPKKKASAEFNIKMIQDCLSYFGILSVTSKRYDIKVLHDSREFKITGSAFKQTRDRHLHHGTLLVNSDTSLLIELLRPKKVKLSTKAIDSIPSPVINLSELNPEITIEVLKDVLIDSFKKYLGECDVYFDFDISLIGDYENASSWHHVFANTPKFSLDYQIHELNFSVKVEKGLIEEVYIVLEGLHPDYFKEFCDSMVGKRYDPNNLISELSKEIAEEKVLSDLRNALID